jgi:hypothetical protein
MREANGFCFTVGGFGSTPPIGNRTSRVAGDFCFLAVGKVCPPPMIFSMSLFGFMAIFDCAVPVSPNTSMIAK